MSETGFSDECALCEQHAREKPTWGPGPWQEEPERVEFAHAGLPCLLHRGGVGTWCGYIGVPKTHPLYGVDYDTPAVEIHGGLTYAGECEGHICHRGDEADVRYWFGFDCGHAGDFAPALNALIPDRAARLFIAGLSEHYWTVAEARAETERLADQLAALGETR